MRSVLVRGKGRSFTLIELLVVIAIIGILATFLLAAVGATKDKAKQAVAGAQIKSLTTSLEAYNTDVGYYPRDPRNVFGADIPHYLFAALHNKPTQSLGGGPNTPYYDADNSAIGIMNNQKDFRELFTAAGTSTPVNFTTPDDVNPKADPIDQNQNHNTSTFQQMFNYANAPANINLDAVSNYPVYLDPWGNPYHYREWSLKPEAGGGQSKESWAQPSQAQDMRCYNFTKFDIWSNGPDGVNNYGHPDSDDVTNWGRK